MVQFRLDISTYPLLRKLLIKVASQHVKTKADAFPKGIIQKALREMDDDDQMQLADKMTILFLFFGLHRRSETLEMQVKDVSFTDGGDINANHPHATKRDARGFSHKIPGHNKPSFEQCINQFSKSTKDDSRFLKNHNVKSKCRHQNYGINKVKGLAKTIATKCGLIGKCTTHSFRRSASTSLAESGMSIVALCHAGRWKSYKTAKGCTEHSNVEKNDRMN